MGSGRQLRRGIYLLPTLFTIGNLFCGYLSLVRSAEGRTEQAALLIIVAGLLDGLDGRIARLSRSTSEFGLQFDSLADLVSFGVAPALLAYHWALTPLGRVGWLVTFLFVVCAAMRLGRFNIQIASHDRKFFAGLPSPAAAGVLACLAFAFPEAPEPTWLAAPIAVYVACLGLLMVSHLRYRSFREIDLRSRRSYLYVLPLAAALVAIALHPKGALLLLSIAYLVSAPSIYLWNWARRANVARPAKEAEVVDESLVR